MLSQRGLVIISNERWIDLACVIYCLIRRLLLFKTFNLYLLKSLFLRQVIEICDLFKLSALVNKLLLITGSRLVLVIILEAWRYFHIESLVHLSFFSNGVMLSYLHLVPRVLTILAVTCYRIRLFLIGQDVVPLFVIFHYLYRSIKFNIKN